MALTNTSGWVIKYLSLTNFSTAVRARQRKPGTRTSPARRIAGPQGALPIGISFIGARWHDADALDLAYAFVTATKARRAPGYLATVGADSSARPPSSVPAPAVATTVSGNSAAGPLRCTHATR